MSINSSKKVHLIKFLIYFFVDTRNVEVLNSLTMKITAKENNVNDILLTFR